MKRVSSPPFCHAAEVCLSDNSAMLRRRQAWEYFLLHPKSLQWIDHWLRGGHPAKHYHKAIRELQEAVGTIIRQARRHHSHGTPTSSSSSGSSSLIHGSSFLHELMREEEDGNLTAAQLQQLVLEMLLAGTDTSSVTLSWLPLALAEDPTLERELHKEVIELTAGTLGAS